MTMPQTIAVTIDVPIEMLIDSIPTKMNPPRPSAQKKA
jgi:hypothetical protein